MALYVGVRSRFDMKRRIGMHSPRTGAPSMSSNFVSVSLSLYCCPPDPEPAGERTGNECVGSRASGTSLKTWVRLVRAPCSRRIIFNSMCFILIRTSRKYTFPMMMSFMWYFCWLYSNSICKHSSMPTSILIVVSAVGGAVTSYFLAMLSIWSFGYHQI